MQKRSHHYNNVRKINSELISSPDGQNDLFSELVNWMADHTLVVFSALLLFLLLLAASCDHFEADADASVLDSSFAGHADPASTDDKPISQAPAISQTDPDTGGAISVLAEGLSGLFADASESAGDFSLRWRDGIGTLAFRLTLAALLGAAVAFRPRRSLPLRHRDPYVVQSQILLAVVACALMMIVGDSAARAFGIFAAASLVRFRTNIRDPKEITVLLINLGVGLAAGVGRWELATIFSVFVLVLLQILESYEDRQTLHLMELSVRTHDVEATDEVVREMFRRNNLDADIKELNRESEKHPVGKVVYSVDVSPKLNRERLAEEIYLADPANIEKLEWHRRKAPSYA